MIARNPESVLITGASSGIGRATALELSRQGRSLFLSGRDRERLAGVASECQELSGQEVPYLAIDLTERGSGEELAAAARGLEIGALLHGAGLGYFGPPEAHDDEVLSGLLDANFLSAARVTRALLPGFRERRRGHFIYVLSVAAKRPFANVAGYCASKFALRGYAEALRQDLRGTGIAITCAMPVATRTPFWERAGYRNWEATHANTAVHDPETIAPGIARCLETRPREWFPDLRSRVLDMGQRLTPTTIEWLNSRGTPSVEPDFSGSSELLADPPTTGD